MNLVRIVNERLIQMYGSVEFLVLPWIGCKQNEVMFQVPCKTRVFNSNVTFEMRQWQS